MEKRIPNVYMKMGEKDLNNQAKIIDALRILELPKVLDVILTRCDVFLGYNILCNKPTQVPESFPGVLMGRIPLVTSQSDCPFPLNYQMSRVFYVLARRYESMHRLLVLYTNNAMPNAISEIPYKPVSSLYATLSYLSSSQCSRGFNSSGSLKGSLICKPDFDWIHPLHVLCPTYKVCKLANDLLLNMQEELTPICKLPPKVFASIRHNDHRQD
jgi:hypothetical protein